MADGNRRHRLRLIALWSITVIVAGWAVVSAASRDDDDIPDAPSVTSDADPNKLEVTALSAAEVSPGDAVIVRVVGIDPAGPPLSAGVGRLDAEVLSQSGDVLVVRIPQGVASGKAPLRVRQGMRRSKARDLLVHQVHLGKAARNALGGLALFILGLSLLSRGLRRLAGQRLRALVGRLTRGSLRGIGFGVVAGGTTQLTTTAAGLTKSLLESRLIALGPAIALLVGAQLGAAATSALLPVSFTREGLYLVVLGVLWMSAGPDRQSEGIGGTFLGIGLLLYGLHLLYQGFQPLVTDPRILPYVHGLQGTSPITLLACAAIGVALSAVLQGPGPLFALVAGMVGVSGALSLENALAILAGCGLGGGIDVALVAWSSGRDGRRLALGQLLLGAASTLFMLITVPLWTHLADALVPGDPHEALYGHRLLLPRFNTHLAVGFVAAQLAATGLQAALLGPVLRWVGQRFRGAPDAVRTPAVVHRSLADAVSQDRQAVDALLGLVLRGERALAADSERALQDARKTVEDVFAALVVRTGVDSADDGWRRTVVATLQLQRTIEDLLHVAELAVERNLTIHGEDRPTLEAVHKIVLDGLDTLAHALASGVPPDLEAARAREIRLNAREAEARVSAIRPPEGEQSGSLHLRVTEILDAYENVGNHIYRVCESFPGDVPESVA